jgi:hypothetical protein
MLTLIIALVIAAAVTFVLIKKGKIADANNNNIPDAIEKPIAAVKSAIVEVKEEVAAKVKKPAAKKPADKKAPAKKSVKKNK